MSDIRPSAAPNSNLSNCMIFHFLDWRESETLRRSPEGLRPHGIRFIDAEKSFPNGARPKRSAMHACAAKSV